MPSKDRNGLKTKCLWRGEAGGVRGPEFGAEAYPFALGRGNLGPRRRIALKVDQTLLQDVLGTLVMLELEAMGIERVKVDSRRNTSITTSSRTIT